MALGDLFKSKKERDRDQQKKKRKAFREAESAVDEVQGQVNRIKKDRDKAWDEARKYLREGQKSASKRCLQTVRSNDVLMNKLEQKVIVSKHYIAQLQSAQSDEQLSKALKAINTVINIDPEAVADVIDEVQDKLGEQVDTEKIWAKAHEKEMAGVERDTDSMLSMEEMEKQLEDEVAADVSDDRPAKRGEKQGNVKDRIGEGRDRLRDMLEGDK